MSVSQRLSVSVVGCRWHSIQLKMMLYCVTAALVACAAQHVVIHFCCRSQKCDGVQVAQAVLVPLLVDKEKVGPSSLRAIKSMMVMQPPPTFTVRPALLTIISFCMLSCKAAETLLNVCTGNKAVSAGV